MEKVKIRVSLVGNPNVGKSTVFNQLTGLNQHTGNWPGKTVEKRVGYVEKDNYLIEITDLPGIYSLTAHSLEELIAREFIIKEKPDVIVLIVDASCLERNLYLLAQLLEIHSNIVIGLNMLDILKSRRYKLDVEKFKERLKLPVIPMVASKGQGLEELIQQVINNYRDSNINSIRIEYPELEDVINRIEGLLDSDLEEYPKRWVTLKLLEGDEVAVKTCKEKIKDWEVIKQIIEEREDNPVRVASARYNWIKKILNGVLERPQKQVISWTDKLDEIFTHPIWGLPVAIVIVASIFYLTYTLNGLIIGPWEELLGFFEKGISIIFNFLPEWWKNLIVGGIWQGVSTVLSFTPLIVIFFLFLALLEDTGYLARLAFVTDRIMHFLGLHGKSFIPLVISFGCNVPGIMATRILENDKDRKLMIILDPFVPCIPRILVASFFLGIFFPKYAFVLLLSLYGISLFSIIVSGMILRKRILKASVTPLLMELPIYKIPTLKIVFFYVWEKLKSFLVRAGTIMILLSGIIWILSNVPSEDISNSILARVGKILLPILSHLGFNWQLTIGLITGFVAKEASLSVLGAIYGVSGSELGKNLLKEISPITAYVFVVFQLLYIPCAATVATIYKETNSLKWTLFAVSFSLIYAYLFTFILYRILMVIVG